jgi:hypothetical protein
MTGAHGDYTVACYGRGESGQLPTKQGGWWDTYSQVGLFILHLILAFVSFVVKVGKGQAEGRVSAWWGQATWGPEKCATNYNGTNICPYQGENPPTEYRIDFSLLLVFSELITAMSHFVRWNCCKSAFINKLGDYQRINGVKTVCWIEYVFTAAMTSHVVLHLGGMWDIRTQMIAYASQALLMVAGFSQDLMRAISLSSTGDINQSGELASGIGFVFVIGAFGLMTIWIWPLLTLWEGKNLGKGDDSAPSWVKGLVLCEFLLYAAFGVGQFLFYLPYFVDVCKCCRFDYEQNRRWWFKREQILFDVLSFLSKFLLNFAFCACFVFGACGP